MVADFFIIEFGGLGEEGFLGGEWESIVNSLRIANWYGNDKIIFSLSYAVEVSSEEQLREKVFLVRIFSTKVGTY